VELTTLLGSRYVTHLRPAVEAFQAKLMLLDDICGELITVQRHWVYLEQASVTAVELTLAPPMPPACTRPS